MATSELGEYGQLLLKAAALEAALATATRRAKAAEGLVKLLREYRAAEKAYAELELKAATGDEAPTMDEWVAAQSRLAIATQDADAALAGGEEGGARGE